MEKLVTDLKTLCSSDFAGRLSGTIGAKRAAAFIAHELENLGFDPIGKDGFFEPVVVPATRLVDPVSLRVGQWNLLHRIEFGEVAYYGGGNIEGELVVIDENTNLDEKDLRGKVVLILTDSNEYDLHSTVQSAKEIGIQAIFIDGGEPRWFHKSIMGNYETNEETIPVIKIRSSILPELIQLEGEHVRLLLPLITSSLPCQNVMGILPGQDPKGKTIGLVTHYDFVGDDPNGFRFEGAGDNAAGVSTMLEVGRKISDLKGKLPFNILFVFTTGEESNLWGERHLAANPPIPLSKTVYLDALGRTPYYSLNFMFHPKDKDFVNVLFNQCQKDHIKTNQKETGTHLFNLLITGTSRIKFRPYHTPDDTLELIHIKVLEEVATMLYNSILELERNYDII